MHQHSDPTGVSAFYPVVSKCSVETESTESLSCNPLSSFEVEDFSSSKEEDHNQQEGSSKKNSPRLGRKFLSGIKGAWISKRKKVIGGRENPVSLLAEEEEDEEDDDRAAAAIGVDTTDTAIGDGENQYTQPLESSYRINSDMYSDSDLDDDAMEPIVGQYHLLDEETSTARDTADNNHPRPPSVELGSVEVVAEGTGSTLTGLHYILEELRPEEEGLLSTEESVLRPPSVEVMHMDDIPEELERSPAYHPLVDDDDGEEEYQDTIEAISFPIQLSYKSPKPNSSPDHSNKSSSPHSRTTTSGNSQADYEVRETNRRSSQIRNCKEVVVDIDGNATVHSSSTSSSNYHVHSPNIREGAMPGERFFTSTPAVGEEDLNICSLSLSPNKSGKRDIMEQLMQRFPPSSNSSHRAHSPHTISSASISNTSSSGSETKQPLKFVAIKKGADDSSPKHSIGAIIKPRISKGERPPMQTFTSYQKPPQSPRKDVIRSGGARTPTRTPPPRSEYGNNSGANTPSSPPVIMDGPVRSDLKIATKPHGVRSGSGRGMVLHPPSSELLYQQPDLQSVTSELTESVAVTVDEGTNDGAQEVVTSLHQTMVVTPEKERRRLHQKWNEQQQQQHDTFFRKDAQDCKKENVAMISPDKRG
jgi:hypothetical protein